MHITVSLFEFLFAVRENDVEHLVKLFPVVRGLSKKFQQNVLHLRDQN